MAVLIRKLRLPEYFAIGTETSRAVGAKVNVDSVAFKNWGRRSVAVLGMNLKRILFVKNFDILEYLSAISIQTERPQ